MQKFRTGIVLCISVWAYGCSSGDGENAPAQTNATEQTVVNNAPETDQRPNILLIVADDLGFADISTFGGEIPTPNIDALALQGVKLTRFYTNMTCSPTRAMLLSGTDNHLAGIGNMAETIADNQKGLPGYETYLNDSVLTIAELLQEGGYHTYMTGKWHLGLEYEQGPHSRGFERSFALLYGGASHFSDMAGSGLDRPKALYRDEGELVDALPEDFYSTDFYTDRMIRYIDDNQSDEQPFLAYLAYTAPHWPLHAPDDYLQKYRGSYDEGYDVIRERRFNRVKSLGLIPETATLPPRPAGIPAWDSLPEEEKQIRARHMEVYAAMIDNLDHNIGRLISYLKLIGKFENTFIVFMSDNGADAFDSSSAPSIVKFGQTFDNSLENIGRRNSYVLYGPWWAHVGEAPFRLFKGTSAEGGIRAPAILSYPGSNRANTINPNPMTVMDILPTALALAGIDHPGSEINGREIHPPTGRSLLPAVTGDSDSIHPDDYSFGIELWGKTALIRGDWKILKMAPGQGTGEWELFNLLQDPGEQTNLAATEPQILAEMTDAWNHYAEENNIVLPEGPFRIHSPEVLPVR